jgi:uncharacterized protein YjbI with pentapeptide repeats
VVWRVPEAYGRLLAHKALAETGKSVDQIIIEHEHDLRVLLVQIVGGVALLLGVFRGWEEFRQSQERNTKEMAMRREEQVTERFSCAIDQLGHGTMDIRLGGIYTLARIARDYEDYHWTVMEVLCAFVRTHAIEPPPVIAADSVSPEEADETETKPTVDIQAALTAIGSREQGREIGETQRLDLRGTYLRGAVLMGLNLANAQLDEANLQDARLDEADLQDAQLDEANLKGAWLFSANLQGAWLFRVNLQGAQLGEANLQGARLSGANLQDASLNEANLQGAQLFNANLQDADLNSADLQGAKLFSADLQGVWLESANLQGANLGSSKLQGARLAIANLQDVKLLGANLQGAELGFADLQHSHGLTWEQLESANGSYGATLPDYLVNTPEGYGKAKAGGTNLDGVPVPEGYVEQDTAPPQTESAQDGAGELAGAVETDTHSH